MINPPLVSFLMPVFNADNYLVESIESVLKQQYENIEFIIVDDGSTDSSPDVISYYRGKDSRVISVRQENQGVSAARNKGLTLAKGEYIALLDADDVCHPQRVIRQLSYINEHHLDICGSGLETFGEVKKNKITMYPEEDARLKFNLLFFGRSLPCPTVMMRRESVKNMFFNEGLDFAEDYAFWVRAFVEKNAKLGNVPESLVSYRVHEQQASSRLVEKNKNVLTQVVFEVLHAAGMSVDLSLVREHYNVIKCRKKLTSEEFDSYTQFLNDLYQWLCRYCDCTAFYADFLVSLATGQAHLGGKVRQWLFRQEACQQASILTPSLRLRLSCKWLFQFYR
ncbi:MAG: glycosyltransferase [Endozoicomonas sp.]